MISSARVTSLLRLWTAAWPARPVGFAVAALLAASSALASPQVAGGTGAAAAAVSGQPDRVVTPSTPDATRAELTTLLEQALRRASDASLKAADRSRAESEVAAVRKRLEAGDMQPGDRILVTIITDSLRRADMAVRDGPSLDFGAIPSLDLGGVLRSELQPAIHQHLSKYFRSPEVRVQFLTRISILGAVQRPGSHAVPPFALVSDVITQVAGGPLPSANTDKIVVTRDGREIVDEKAYRRAARDGSTVEQLGLRSGDEIRVGERGRRNWYQVAMVTTVAVSVFTAALALIRSSYSE